MIRVDAYVSLRLAMKVCDSRLELLVPINKVTDKKEEPKAESKDSDKENNTHKNVQGEKCA